jgi:hypothetical protein
MRILLSARVAEEEEQWNQINRDVSIGSRKYHRALQWRAGGFVAICMALLHFTVGCARGGGRISVQAANVGAQLPWNRRPPAPGMTQ